MVNGDAASQTGGDTFFAKALWTPEMEQSHAEYYKNRKVVRVVTPRPWFVRQCRAWGRKLYVLARMLLRM